MGTLLPGEGAGPGGSRGLQGDGARRGPGLGSLGDVLRRVSGRVHRGRGGVVRRRGRRLGDSVRVTRFGGQSAMYRTIARSRCRNAVLLVEVMENVNA